jgi:hypothetical protein
MYEYCQVCGNPIFTAEAHGTDANGQYNRDFCSNCYHNGQFSTWHYNESPLALAAPYYPGIYGYVGYNLH